MLYLHPAEEVDDGILVYTVQCEEDAEIVLSMMDFDDEDVSVRIVMCCQPLHNGQLKPTVISRTNSVWTYIVSNPQINKAESIALELLQECITAFGLHASTTLDDLFDGWHAVFLKVKKSNGKYRPLVIADYSAMMLAEVQAAHVEREIPKYSKAIGDILANSRKRLFPDPVLHTNSSTNYGQATLSKFFLTSDADARLEAWQKCIFSTEENTPLKAVKRREGIKNARRLKARKSCLEDQ